MTISVLLLNFSLLNIASLKQSVEAEVKTQVDVLDIRVSMNLKGNCYAQIVQLLEPYRQQMLEHGLVIIVPPALSIGAIYIVNEVEAITKRPPFIVEIEKDDESSSVLGNTFVLKRVRSLALERQVSRKRAEQYGIEPA